MKKLLLVCIALFVVIFARSAPLALIVLNTGHSVSNLPADWQVKVNHGKPEVSVCTDHSDACVHLKSTKASFSLERSVDVDPHQLPILTWQWRVAQLPAGGDFRHTSTDDQAAQVLVAFDDRHIVSYIWDTSAPKGAEQRTTFIPLVHVFAVVCQSGNSGLNQWIGESRNVAADYERAYGKPAPRIKGLRLQINSQHTGTVAESYFGEVAFRSTPQ